MSTSIRHWLPHLVCLGIVLIECGLWALLHRSEAQLEAAARAGDPHTRIAALHVLTNRGEPAPERFDQAFVEALLEDESELMRDYAFTTDVAKHADPMPQYRALKELLRRPDEPAFWRGFVLHHRKLGGKTGGSSTRLRLQELNWYLDARAGRPLPGAELLHHLQTHP